MSKWMRILTTSAAMMTPALAAAQPARPEAPADPTGRQAGTELTEQLLTFAGALESAVQNGGIRLADRARQIVPDVELAMQGAPLINPVAIPGVGYHFDVQVPDIFGTSLMLFNLYQLERQEMERQEMVRGVSNRPGTPPVSATGVVEADPMVSSPGFDPNREYGVFVRDALKNAMLDSSVVLNLGPGDRLIVSARVPAEVQSNPLAVETSGRLVLQIRAEDLEAFRARRITRDEARERIIESRH